MVRRARMLWMVVSSAAAVQRREKLAGDVPDVKPQRFGLPDNIAAGQGPLEHRKKREYQKSRSLSRPS